MEFALDKSGDIGKAVVRESPPLNVGPGELLVRVEKAAFTANVVSYALSGNALGYFKFFPLEDGNAVPTWGIAKVLVSRHPDVREGELLYGMLPFNSLVILRASRVTPDSIMDLGEHRRDLSPVYNTYSRLDSGLDAFYQPGKIGFSGDRLQDLMILLRPLFLTAWLLKEFCNGIVPENGRLILTSASSKTAYAMAYLVRNCSGKDTNPLKVVGLTSSRNETFVKSLGVYDQVVLYDNIESEILASGGGGPARIVDMSGNGPVLRRIIAAAPGTECSLVGATHVEEAGAAAGGGSEKLPGTFFFAPSQAAAIAKKVGPAAFQELVSRDWAAFTTHVEKAKWCSVDKRVGSHAMLSTWKQALAPSGSGVDPKQGVILSLPVSKPSKL